MSKLFRVAIAGLALAFFAETAVAEVVQRGTKEEAVAIVEKVKKMWNSIGPVKTIEAVNKLSHDLRNKDLYPFIAHTDGYVVAHFFQAIRGLKTAEDTDQRGRSIMGDMVKVVRTTGKGWTQYDWPNPITKRIDAKESYIEALDKEYFVAVGVFKKLRDEEIRE